MDEKLKAALKLFQKHLPTHLCGMTIEHNPHEAFYQSVKEYFQDQERTTDISSEDAQKCIETGELWTIQWYPSNPVGFYSEFAPTLERLFERLSYIRN